jgi:hypothetical protein
MTTPLKRRGTSPVNAAAAPTPGERAHHGQRQRYGAWLGYLARDQTHSVEVVLDGLRGEGTDDMEVDPPHGQRSHGY